MGIVNVTPDSFSDGGLYLDPEKAVLHAEHLLDEGADIIDVGGESTRPGTPVLADTDNANAKHDANAKHAVPAMHLDRSKPQPLFEEEELERVEPVIKELKRRRPNVIISVDTYKANVARAAVNAGAEVVNDVSGFRWDPKMIGTLAELKVGAVLMHTRGRPQEWQSLPPIGDPVLMVKRELRQWAESATLGGVKRDRLVLDPGFGFGKRLEENYPLLARYGELQQMGFPLLAGVSRKGFIGRLLARDSTNGQKKDAEVPERLVGTLAAETSLILKGAHIIRTHDVRSAAEAARVADTLVASGG
jgi:dihydropteroate synthase